jgi:hypothetical protein
MQINEQALLGATLSAAVLGDQLGLRVPQWVRLVSVLAISVSLIYSLQKIPSKNQS